MSDTLDLVALLARLRARWRVWVVAALAGAAIGAGVSLLQPICYQADAHLLVKTPPDAVATFSMMSPSYLDSLKSYAVLARGETVRARALESLSPAQRAAAGAILAETPSLSRVLVVRGQAGDPAVALALARAAAEQTVRLVGDAGDERLVLIDPGVEPQRPLDRNAQVNALAAAFFALLAAAFYEGVRFVVNQPIDDG